MRGSHQHSGLFFAFSTVMLITCQSAYSQLPGPDLIPGSGAAKLISFSGQISVLRDSNPWALNLGDIVQPQQFIVTGRDGNGVFLVSDGSKFEVFPNSKVVFRQNRGDWQELLEVWLGKVRVQIEHSGGLPNNNKVRTPTAVISVRGTIFDVEVEDEDATTLVLDEEGQVEVRHLLRAGDPKILSPGEYIRIYKNEPIARKVIDKGGMLQRAVRAASDAFYQVALNAAHNGGTISPTTPQPTDHKPAIPPPPPPPPAPPPPPPPPK
jgi:hypothetical protein